ncbi:MAG TPA: GspE/PulE family protein, partial [Anaeromyxobacteraceae bacterium]|nr:GspE/PulE family protein [Anaeromyxobacteraceae bacterium]
PVSPRDPKAAQTVIDLTRVREELDRITERAEAPAERGAPPFAGWLPPLGAALDAAEAVDGLEAVEVEVVDDGPPPPALAEETLRAALATAAETGRSPVAVLAETSGLGGDALARALGAALHYPVLESAALMALAPAFDLLGPAEAAKRGCAIVRRGQEHLAVIGDPFDLALRGWLELRIPEVLSWHLAAPDEITAYVAKFEQDLRAMDVAAVGGDGEKRAEAEVESLSLASISADSSPVVKLVNSTVYDALKAGASDIHLETRPGGLAVRYRLDGVLVHVVTLGGADLCEQVISRVKVMSELDIAERRVPQDGRFRLALKGRPIDFRVSVMPSVHGEDAVLRILDKQALTDELQGLRLDGLGFEAEVVRRLRRLSELPYGMLLVTGPTGSGKTTTLYAAISETNTGRDKIVTIEDPVEYQLAGVLQIPVNEKKGLTFARGLRSILRHDPDKIMVGEIRDPETAQIAIQSALTGHLVFTTVHANNVFDVLGRFTHMQADAYALVSALNGILAQRLVRVVCEQCAEPAEPSMEAMRLAGLSLAGASHWTFRSGRGCAHCRGTGYKGRRAIGELLILNDELREAIVARAPARRLKELALAGGSKLLRSAALELVQHGVTTLLEADRVTALA